MRKQASVACCAEPADQRYEPAPVVAGSSGDTVKVTASLLQPLPALSLSSAASLSALLLVSGNRAGGCGQGGAQIG